MKSTLKLMAMTAIIGSCLFSASVSQASETPALIKAQGHPYLNTYKVHANRRADLRYKKATQGIDIAFTEWLRHERPAVYRETLKRIAAKKTDTKQVVQNGKQD